MVGAQVWRNADLARFPANAAQSLMKVGSLGVVLQMAVIADLPHVSPVLRRYEWLRHGVSMPQKSMC